MRLFFSLSEFLPIRDASWLILSRILQVCTLHITLKIIPFFFASFIYTVFREIFAPPPFFRPFHPGCPKVNSNASNYLSLNQTLFWANSRRAKPFAGKEIKINRGENNPVYITVILVSNVSASHCQHVSCNGGHCLSKDQSYICICPVGYDGRNCQHKGELFDS